jgi:predicted nuclease with TOPRIM domain
LVDLAKYDSLIQDLSMIEAEVSTLAEKLRDNGERETELDIQIAKLRQENSHLQKRILEIEQDFEFFKEDKEGNILNTLNSKERETLKLKLQDLISRIDYHLSADRQI